MRACPRTASGALLADRAGALWIGTWGGGLCRVSGSGILLMAGADAVPEPPVLSDRDVTALAYDADGGLWIGTRNGTLLRKDEKTGALRPYPAGAGSILRILPLDDGTVWVGTSMGIERVDRRSAEVTRLRHDPTQASSIGPGFVSAIRENGAGHFWVGTGEGGVQELRRDGRVLRRFVHQPGDPASLSDDYVTVVHEDGTGTLWVGTRSGGLNALDPRTGGRSAIAPTPRTRVPSAATT